MLHHEDDGMMRSGGNKVYIASMDYNTMQVQSQQLIFPSAKNIANQNYMRMAGVGDTLGLVWRKQVGPSEVMFAHSFDGPSGIGNWIDTLTSVMSGAQGSPDIVTGIGKLHVTF